MTPFTMTSRRVIIPAATLSRLDPATASSADAGRINSGNPHELLVDQFAQTILHLPLSPFPPRVRAGVGASSRLVPVFPGVSLLIPVSFFTLVFHLFASLPMGWLFYIFSLNFARPSDFSSIPSTPSFCIGNVWL